MWKGCSVANLKQELNEEIRGLKRQQPTKKKPQMPVTRQTKLVKMDTEGYDTSNMTFSDPKNVTTKSGFSFDTVQIGTKNDDGSEGDLIFRSVADLFCKGLEKATDFNDSEKFKWQMPISFQDRNQSTGFTDPTPEQAAWMECWDAIMTKAIDWIMDNLDKLGLEDDYPRPRLQSFTPMYYAKEKDPKTGKATKRIAEGAGPWLYTKVPWNPVTDEFQSQFFDKNNYELHPDSIKERHFKAQVALKFESLTIMASGIHPQVKLFEAVLEEMGSSRTRILGTEDDCVRLSSDPKVKVSSNTTSTAPLGDDDDLVAPVEDDDDDDDEGSVGGAENLDSDEEPEPEPEPAKKKVVKRRPKLKAAK